MTTIRPDFIQNIAQVGIVVRDLDLALRGYADRLGVGPWRVSTYAAPRLTGTRVRGVPVDYSMRIALAWTGTMNWELIQPLEGPSIYREFLEAHGEGLHHILVDCGDRSLEQMIAEFGARGWKPLMEGCFMGNSFVYFDTEDELSTLVEIRHAAVDWRRPEPDAWYPAAPR
jgi:methylmalonyl-CoA/ethylmalonyl-CoA epimerase